MKEDDFNNLVKSIKQAGKIKAGQLKPGRTFEFKPMDIKAIRNKLHKSQSEFALMIGVSVSTLQNLEQGRRKPLIRRKRGAPGSNPRELLSRILDGRVPDEGMAVEVGLAHADRLGPADATGRRRRRARPASARR